MGLQGSLEQGGRNVFTDSFDKHHLDKLDAVMISITRFLTMFSTNLAFFLKIKKNQIKKKLALFVRKLQVAVGGDQLSSNSNELLSRGCHLRDRNNDLTASTLLHSLVASTGVSGTDSKNR